MAGELAQLTAEVAPAAGFRFVAPKQAGRMAARRGLVLPDQVAQEGQGLAGLKIPGPALF